MATTMFVLVIAITVIVSVNTDNKCNNNNDEYKCKTDTFYYDDAWGTDKVFQTPYRGHPHWKSTYQDMNLILGYVQQKYQSSSSSSNTCTININYRLNTKHLPLYSQVLFTYGTHTSTLSTYTVTQDTTMQYKDNGMPVSISIVNYLHQVEAILEFEPIYFKWNNARVESTLTGAYGAIVELFGWPYEDIEKECSFLGNSKYLGVQILPPVETILDFNSTVNGHLNPWHYAYQPVSYKLTSRMGNRTQLKRMVDVCRSKGVRVYSETVINHMTSFGVDAYPHHQDTSCNTYGSISSTGGSPWYTGGNMVESNEITVDAITGIEFPAVPYDSRDFHCKKSSANESMSWYKDRLDLRTESEYVQQRIADHLTDLISIGITGFSFDMVRQVHRNDVIGILNKLRDNLGGSLPEDFLVYMKLLLGGEFDKYLCSTSSEYSYGDAFYNALTMWTQKEKQQIKVWRSDFPKEFSKCAVKVGEKYQSMLGLDFYLEQFDTTSRDPPEESIYVKYHDVEKHKTYLMKLFGVGVEGSQSDIEQYNGNDYVVILSSYSFDNDAVSVFDTGIPDGLSDCGLSLVDGCDNSMPKVQAYDEASKGYDAKDGGNWVDNVYTRVHRSEDVVTTMQQWLSKKQK